MVDRDPTGKLSPLCNLLHSGVAWICFKNDHTHPPSLFSRWPECNMCNRFLFLGSGGCVGTVGTFTDIRWRWNALFFLWEDGKKDRPSIPFCFPKGGVYGSKNPCRPVSPSACPTLSSSPDTFISEDTWQNNNGHYSDPKWLRNPRWNHNQSQHFDVGQQGVVKARKNKFPSHSLWIFVVMLSSGTADFWLQLGARFFPLPLDLVGAIILTVTFRPTMAWTGS